MKRRNAKRLQTSATNCRSSGRSSAVLRWMVAVSVLVGTFAFVRTAEATVAAAGCGIGDGQVCSTFEFCLFGICISGTRYYNEEPEEELPVFFCTSKTC